MKALVLALGVLGAASIANADVLYSNFGPGDTYLPNIGETLAFGGPLGGDSYEHAVPFTVTGGAYTLDSAEVAVMRFWGPDMVNADLRADAGGSPGEILESTANGGTCTPGQIERPLILFFSGDLVLEEGATYWLALRTQPTDAHLAWAHNAVEDFGLRAWRTNEGAWNTGVGDPATDSERAVFRINATPVPAPGMLALAGVAGLAAVRRRRSS